MSSRKWAFALVSLLPLLSPLPSLADGPLLTHRGVLLLRNGRVLTGTVSAEGDRYVVYLGNKDEVGVPTSQVAFAGATLDDAYVYQRDREPPKTPEAHLALGEWCLGCGLLSRAAEELLAARVQSPEFAAADAFEKRLWAARQAGSAAATPVVGPTASLASRPVNPPGHSPWSPQVVEQFTRSVQPLLLNRCGNAGCHGLYSTSTFRLLRSTRGRGLSRQFTERNLEATLAMVDQQSPDKSRLLRVPLGPHGPLHEAVFGNGERDELAQLAAWVQRAAQPTRIGTPAAIVAPASILSQAGGGPPGHRGFATMADPAGETGQATPDPRAKSRPNPVPRTPTGERPPSADPFDPNVFQRRYGSKPAGRSDAGPLPVSTAGH